MRRTLSLVCLMPLLAACVAALPGGTPPAPEEPAITVIESPDASVLRPRARVVPGAEAPPAPAADGFLGETLAGLGAPGEPGLWLATGLVDSARAGRVVTEDGRSLDLELRPSGAAPGAGSQISLAAMRALGLPLPQLATLRVFLR